MITAEQTYADAEKRFGSNAPAVLEMFQPGQDPRRFLDGFQNAYFAGKMGSSAALKNSGAAAYLDQEQRLKAYELGMREERKVENDGNSDIIRTGERKFAMSLRRPKGYLLTDIEIESIIEDARSIGIDVSLLHFNTGTQTAFMDPYG